MARWAADAPERLQRSALDLFVAQGFEHTTAADIARAAGLTERTFFRYFADKRDVLFHGQAGYVATFLTGIATAPTNESPVQLIAAALHGAAAAFGEDRRAPARTRHTIIRSIDALLERERSKHAELSRAIQAAFRDRGLDMLTAAVAAESAVAVWSLSFERWTYEDETRSLDTLVDEGLQRLIALGTPG